MNDQTSQLALCALMILTVYGAFLAAFRLYETRQPHGQLSDEERQKLEELLADTGYAYDERQDIFYARMDAWQRRYGYCQLYDEAAVPLSMVIDCEPVRFEYRGEQWLIEFWKGQYGITTGGEIGIYKSEGSESADSNTLTGTFYHSVGDEERLSMSMTLRKGQRVLFCRDEKHWWLTGFVLGEFSEPSELVMDASVAFQDGGMQTAFVDGLVRMGYSDRELRTEGSTVSLTFQTPRSRQPYFRTERLAELIQMKNRFLCEQYRSLTKGPFSLYEYLEALRRDYPELFGLVIGMGRPAGLFTVYEQVSNRLKGTAE